MQQFIEFWAFLVVLIGTSYAVVDDTRTVSKVLLNCTSLSNSTEKSFNISHLAFTGKSDALHYIHATHGAPTVIVARTLSDSIANLTVNCSDYLSGNKTAGKSVKLWPAPIVSIALSFTKLIQFDDTAKTADLSKYAMLNTSWIKTYSLSNVTWDLTVNDDHTVELHLSELYGLMQPNSSSSVAFKFHMYTEDGFFPDRPNLEYRDNVTLVEVILDKLSTHAPSSRFAVEMVLTKSTNIGNDMNIQRSYSIDDEISPGSFSAFNWEIKGLQSNDDVAYLRWRPSCFTDPQRTVQSMVKSNHYPLVNYSMPKEDSSYVDGLAYAFYGEDLNATNVRATNISFGGAGDDPSLYYNSTGYNTWMVSFGFGAPPSEQVSLMIILICSIGIGIPFLLLIFTGLFMVAKRLRERYSEYSLISRSYAEIN